MPTTSRFTESQISTIVQMGQEHGPTKASKELMKDGIRISPGGIYFHMVKHGVVGPKVRKKKQA